MEVGLDGGSGPHDALNIVVTALDSFHDVPGVFILIISHTLKILKLVQNGLPIQVAFPARGGDEVALFLLPVLQMDVGDTIQEIKRLNFGPSAPVGKKIGRIVTHL
jgi:hypothetical protein